MCPLHLWDDTWDDALLEQWLCTIPHAASRSGRSTAPACCEVARDSSDFDAIDDGMPEGAWHDGLVAPEAVLVS